MDNKRVTNKQILQKIDDLKVGDEGLNALAMKIVSRMVKLKSMEDWFQHVSKSEASWSQSYAELELTEEEAAIGEAAKLMTLMELFKGEEGLNTLAIKIVSRMVKLKSMEDWFEHVSRSDVASTVAYKDLELTEEENALGDAAKLMTLMEMFKQDENYEKCAIIRNRMDEVNKILKRGNK